MDTETSIRRRKLKFRAWHRGTREMDLLMGRFADAHLDAFGADQLDRFEALLGESDPDIYDWVTGRQAPSADQASDVVELLRRFSNQAE
ncbi:MAG: succinate dehydrogenase assembly factor 2 [Alphaproteobacteria bacterium]|nr:succinate dehydrogenase assembly factor 2 [Alphaproteobacteria bacterium]